ncbi:protein phosphatase 2C domain-containing protein [Candidatus Saccharibacteria bacterium]|nr:protein phosphatase 2C domain-containing protein [Candidatus Saccharibacteria bacterium]
MSPKSLEVIPAQAPNPALDDIVKSPEVESGHGPRLSLADYVTAASELNSYSVPGSLAQLEHAKAAVGSVTGNEGSRWAGKVQIPEDVYQRARTVVEPEFWQLSPSGVEVANKVSSAKTSAGLTGKEAGMYRAYLTEIKADDTSDAFGKFQKIIGSLSNLSQQITQAGGKPTPDNEPKAPSFDGESSKNPNGSDEEGERSAPQTPNLETPRDKAETSDRNPTIRYGVAERALRGEDASLVDGANHVYGVFDGLGGHSGGALASTKASGAIMNYFAALKGPVTPDQAMVQMQDAFLAARAEVPGGEGGLTTAAVVRIVRFNGETYLIAGNAGDSRIILQHDGRISDVTKEQGEGRLVFNCFGSPEEEVKDEFQVHKLDEGDKLLICSDGITGDLDHQRLTAEEFNDAFGQVDPQASAERFIQLSKKTDDKTAIVLFIGREDGDRVGAPSFDKGGEGQKVDSQSLLAAIQAGIDELNKAAKAAAERAEAEAKAAAERAEAEAAARAAASENPPPPILDPRETPVGYSASRLGKLTQTPQQLTDRAQGRQHRQNPNNPSDVNAPLGRWGRIQRALRPWNTKLAQDLQEAANNRAVRGRHVEHARNAQAAAEAQGDTRAAEAARRNGHILSYGGLPRTILDHFRPVRAHDPHDHKPGRWARMVPESVQRYFDRSSHHH